MSKPLSQYSIADFKELVEYWKKRGIPVSFSGIDPDKTTVFLHGMGSCKCLSLDEELPDIEDLLKDNLKVAKQSNADHLEYLVQLERKLLALPAAAEPGKESTDE